MTLYCCPRCQKRELFSTGAFWVCATCRYAITTTALFRDQNLQTESRFQVEQYAETQVRVFGGLKIVLQIVILIVGLILGWLSLVLAEEPAPSHRHDGNVQEQNLHDGKEACRTSTAGEINGLESLQIETSDLKLYEGFFESILQAPSVLRMDHPQKDVLRGYCYRGISIIVRQDLQQARPTGWIQINFSVQDVGAVQGELERAYQGSSVFKLEEAERNKIIRFKLKPDVMRGNRKAARLEVFGPEGFMIGFDQYK